MSLSTQERQARTENPFAIFGQGRAYPSSSAYRYTHQYGVPSRAAKPSALPQHRLVAAPARIRPNSQRSMPVLCKKLAGILILALIVFSLLPNTMQKRCYALFGWKEAPAVHVSSPLPVAYAYISSPFGKRWGRQHQGIDFAAPFNAPIYASSAGTVVYSGWESGYGKSIVIDHGNGIKTRYAHCSKLLVPVGKVVDKGALIAKVGSTGHSTGPHLHFEVIVKGVRKNPAWYYAFRRTSTAQVAQASN